MSHAPLPKDCYDIDTAAHLLSMSAQALRKVMREHDWIYVKAYANDKRHNLPKEWTKKAGYLTTQDRGYPAPYNRNAVQLYQVAILTRTGLEAIASIMNQTLILPTVAPLTLENAERKQAEKPNAEDTKEREKALAELESWGFYKSKAS